jgi:chromosome partitioning protein
VRVIAIANQKGGTGKTTTAVNLAAALAETGRRVLLLDLDPQGSASKWYGFHSGGEELAAVIAGKLPITAAIHETAVPGVSVVPSSPGLARAEVDLSTMKAGADRALRRRLQVIAPGSFDYVLIDCAPSLSYLTVNALTTAGEVLIPVEARVMAVAGLAQLLDTLQEIRDVGDHPIEVAGVLACRVDNRTRHARTVLSHLEESYPGAVLRTQIRETIRLGECPAAVSPITEYAPDSTGAADYRDLAREIIEQETTT